jgi:ribosome-binding protein aMBF1 (putative translation factor)
VSHIHKHLGKRHDTCPMCKKSALSERFLWIGMITGHELEVCVECAYKEEFGNKFWRKKKKEKALEKESTN